MKTRTASGKLKAVRYTDEISDQGSSEAVASDHSHDDVDDFHLSNTMEATTASGSTMVKRGKRTAYRASGKGKGVGKLALLLDMPMDIIREIGLHLEPIDLLHLARSTRDFNQLLMSRSSKPIWRSARACHPGLPDCPPDLSEPEYARLIFEKECHGCLAPRIMTVDWILRTRLCARCRSSYIVKGSDLLTTIPDLTEELLECIPSRNDPQGGTQRRFEYFSRLRVQAVVAKYRAALPPNLPHDQVQPAKDEFFKHHKLLLGVIIEHGTNVERWFTYEYRSNRHFAMEAQQRRGTELRAKLRELGYTDNDFLIVDPDQEWSRIMNQPRDLTPRIWNTVHPKLVACIERAKVQHEVYIRGTRMSHRRMEISQQVSNILVSRRNRDMQLFIRIQNVYNLRVVEALMSEDDYQTVITPARWDAVRDQVEKEMDDFAEDVRRELIQLIITSREGITLQPDASNAEILKRAASSGIDTQYLLSPSTFFDCMFCPKVCQYPDMIAHFHSETARWNVENFKFNASATSAAETILSSIFARTDTLERQIVLKHMFRCLRCDRNVSIPMDWYELVFHFTNEQAWFDVALSSRPHNSGLITYNEHDIAVNLATPMATTLTQDEVFRQREVVQAFVRHEPKNQRCAHCHWGGSRTKQEVALHLMRRHLKDFVEENDFQTDTHYMD